jgi:tRNA(fMet)-specific endonuclease VapC
MWHLDSNIVIAYLNGDQRVRDRVLRAGDQLAISTIVLAELRFGAKNSAKATQNLRNVEAFAALVQVPAFDVPAADVYSDVRLGLKRKGKPTGALDMCIAAIAIRDGATLVTHNTADFINIDGLLLEDWLA